MDLSPFKQDIDELIHEFVQSESKTLNDMKIIWLSRKISYIYEASPSTNLAFFMQSLYAHAIGHMVNADSLSFRLGGLYCLYCLYETQPFKPHFKTYLSLGELKKLKSVVSEAKEMSIGVVPTLAKRMLEKNMFLFGFLDLKEGSVIYRFCDGAMSPHGLDIGSYCLMYGGMEVDLNMLKKMSTEYKVARKQAIEEACEVVDVQTIKHISENKESLSEIVEKIDENWNYQREVFHQRAGLSQQPAEEEQPRQIQLEGNEQENNVAHEFFQLLYQNE